MVKKCNFDNDFEAVCYSKNAKIVHFAIFCFERGFSVNTKVVGTDVRFLMALI